ncbi:hypothetical protein GC209_19285 [bacterium]|nr:hypothetical protein [bacterium]
MNELVAAALAQGIQAAIAGYRLYQAGQGKTPEQIEASITSIVEASKARAVAADQALDQAIAAAEAAAASSSPPPVSGSSGG